MGTKIISFSEKPEITIGADPELFLQNRWSKAFVSGHAAIPGTKMEPFPVKAGAVQVDGVAVEFNINPAKTSEEFVNNIETVIDVLRKMISASSPDAVLVAVPTATFDKTYFDALPLEVKELGCSPDFDAYSGSPNTKPFTEEPFRTGAGHIHVGWTDGEDQWDDTHYHDCMMVAQQLDAALYIPSMFWDKDNKRRTLYGKKGAFRPKGYGMEYRALSNAWLFDPDIQKWIFDASVHSVNMLSNGVEFQEDREIRKALHETDESYYDDNYVEMYLKRMYTTYSLPKFPY